MRKTNKERGSQTLEFTLIGIPTTFLLFSIANMCFAMMTLHTMQEAVEQGARMISTRGSTCSTGSNSCSVTVAQIADYIGSQAPGISPRNVKVTLTPANDTGNAIVCDKLSTCQTSCSGGCNSNRTNMWPATTNNDNDPGQDIIVSADCTVAAPMFMFWTGVAGSVKINSTTFHAYSRQRMMF